MKAKATKKRVVVVGGGTGGHVMPALAVAEALQHAGWQVDCIGSQNGPEEELVRQTGLAFHGIHAGKLRRYFSLANVTDFFRVIIGFFQARNVLARLKPTVVFAKGGYVSLPVVYAAAFLEIPTVIHESDAVMGLANRLAAEKAITICTGFPTQLYSDQWQDKLRFTGNPVRRVFYHRRPSRPDILKKYGLQASRPILLVIGGSQGAHPINQVFIDALPELLEDFQVIHLTGLVDSSWAKSTRRELSVRQQKRYLPFAFVADELPELMKVADLVISRSSASVVAELASMGKPTILVPLPHAAGDHQRANAEALRKKGAAIVIEQADLTVEKLLKQCRTLVKDREQRQQLVRAIQVFHSPRAATVIAEIIAKAGETPT